MTAIASPATVDPALFRLRAFETDLARPLVATLSTEDFSTNRWPENTEAALNLTLLLEAEQWIQLGQQTGYFADAPSGVADELHSWTGIAEPLALEIFFQDPPSVTDLDQAGFARALAAARETLTVDRRTFLELMFFAPEPEFRERLQEVEAVVSNVARQPWVSVEPDLVDRIAWSFEDDELEEYLPDAAPPMWWRVTSSHVAWLHEGWWPNELPYAGESPRPTATTRVRQTATARYSIESLMGWDLEYETVPPELRPGIATRWLRDRGLIDRESLPE